MSFTQAGKALLLIATLGTASLALAAEASRYNPFQRWATPQDTSRNSTNVSKANPVRSYHFTHPRLRAVLHAKDGSLANLDGHVLAQGESALGYTLVTVQDHSAKFRFRQHTITLQVTEDRP